MKRPLSIGLLLAILLLATACSGQPEAGQSPGTMPTGVDPEAWALVPAGEFYMGQHDHEMAVEYDFEIMVTPVTNEQFARYLNEALAAGHIQLDGEHIVGFYPGDEFHGYEHEMEINAGDWLHLDLSEPGLRLLYEGGTFSALPEYGNRPVVHVTWFGARAYCEFYDGWLPSEVEWEKAARGTDNRPFPWGDEITRAHANFYSSHDIFEKIVGGLGDTTPVGFYNGREYDGFQTENAVSPYGLYDMAGNVWQWTGDVYDFQHYRYMRGGSKADYAYNLRIWTRNNASPDYHGPSVGFRCAREPVQ
jgi:formylglycine-generating enzyme required for sulfatase activity